MALTKTSVSIDSLISLLQEKLPYDSEAQRAIVSLQMGDLILPLLDNCPDSDGVEHEISLADLAKEGMPKCDEGEPMDLAFPRMIRTKDKEDNNTEDAELDLRTNDDDGKKYDTFLDDASHGVSNLFAKRGGRDLTIDELYQINDFLTTFFDDKRPQLTISRTKDKEDNQFDDKTITSLGNGQD